MTDQPITREALLIARTRGTAFLTTIQLAAIYDAAEATLSEPDRIKAAHQEGYRAAHRSGNWRRGSWSRPMPHDLSDDQIINRLGLPLLRELDAIAWFCDAGPDGRHRLITTHHRQPFAPGGDAVLLIKTGCIRPDRAARPTALRMGQTGRRVLRRCAALRMDLIGHEEACHD